jgi:chromosomal replication initiation ATPase DnaA
VIYACEKVAELIQRDDTLRKQVNQIRDVLLNGAAVH